ncbi:MAG: hypothetical protein PVSMB7_26580 [Chloroflexota bacterium]
MRIRDTDSRHRVSDAYRTGIALRKVTAAVAAGRRPTIACFDVDSTLTGDAGAADEMRRLLDAQGIVTMLNTSRTEEMLMSEAVYAATRATGLFHRPVPHLGLDGTRRVYVPPEEAEAAGILNPDVIAGSTGTRLYIRQEDSRYLPDGEYNNCHVSDPDTWRRGVLNLLHTVEANKLGADLADIDSAERFEQGVTDVYPPEYRLQIHFTDARAKLRLRQRLHAAGRTGDSETARLARSLRLSDDSEPREHRYKAFLMPRDRSKTRAIQRVVDSLVAAGGPKRTEMHLVFGGDSFPDLTMGLLGGIGAQASLLLVGGSRLSSTITDENAHSFAGEDMRAYRRRIWASTDRGVYRFRPPCGAERAVIVGDEAFPGTQAIDTVLAWVQRLTV